MQARCRWPLWLLASWILAPSALPQNLVPNPGFEDGISQPVGWQPPLQGTWTDEAFHGKRALRLDGSGQESAAWRSEPIALEPSGLLSLALHGATCCRGGGALISGPAEVNRDFPAGEAWTSAGFIFSVPEGVNRSSIRLGHWQANGAVLFDDVELLPVQATHQQAVNGMALGEGERIANGVYQFHPNFAWAGANFHRPLHRSRLTFNSDRWCFAPKAELTYRFALPGLQQTSALVRVSLNYHAAGVLRIEASPDGLSWSPIASCDGQRRSTNASLPAAFFPAREIFVRLSTPDGPANLQVNTIDYDARLDQPVADLEGATWFTAVQQAIPELSVQLKSVRPNAGHSLICLDWTVTNRGRNPITVQPQLASAALRAGECDPQSVLPGASASWAMRGELSRPGSHSVEARFTDGAARLLFAGTTEVSRSLLLDPRAGRLLDVPGEPALWWCESGWKIGRDAQAPANGGRHDSAVTITAARGEYEAAQLIIPPGPARLTAMEVTPLRGNHGETASIQVTLSEVAYLSVSRPTDGSCARGWYPDPLPPLVTPFKLPPHNQPLWITVHVAREAKAGDYSGELVMTLDQTSRRIPLQVHIYDFELPRATHLRSALGLGTDTINRYHGLTDRAQQELVYEKYLANFAEHRISPYSFFAYSPIEVSFEGEGGAKKAQVNFTRFDEAATKWLDQARLSSFQLPLRGMGGGTFHSRHVGSLEGFQEGTPEFARLFNDYLGQVADHLRARGWLDKAFTYWFDEPDPKDYSFVVDGMQRIRAAAPGLRRLLTEQPENELLGNVEIWCGLTPEWSREKVAARRAAGEEVWWYVCTGPKSPYVTLFIDHPGLEMRLWPWQSWQYGVQGLLVWETTYWTSPAAFPAPQLQDPWLDPMGYVSGYDFKAGHVAYWGNGDGRFIYPPRRDYGHDPAPCLDGPVNSIRWENLRDGMEDYEYFWVLQQEVTTLAARHGDAALLAQAKALLVVPDEISTDLTHFTTDPRPLAAHRDRMARLIETLRRQPR
ncbi:MAG: DUF4091 domain-containing protein [Verrucomicrobiota bacterium]